MKFFNIDQHSSVIADIAYIFKNLGHEVDDWSLSGHHWVMNKPKPQIMLSDGSQLIGSNVCTQETCDKFYEQYKEQLEQYDAFIVCFPVEFALLYEKWNKLDLSQKELNDANKLFPSNLDIKYELGRVTFNQKNFNEAEKIFTKGEEFALHGHLSLTYRHPLRFWKKEKHRLGSEILPGR